jgi:hypothetical protein
MRIMNRTRWTIVFAVAALAIAAAAVWYAQRETPPTAVIDLIAELPAAEKRSNQEAGPEGIVVEQVSIDGSTRPSILARPFTRIIYTVTVPPSAWLETSFALKPEVWDQPGDGAQFRVGISEGATYDELLRQYVNPKRGDRRWFTARLDLSAYEGRTVKVILNTDPGPPGSGDRTNDEAVWAGPRIYSQR